MVCHADRCDEAVIEMASVAGLYLIEEAGRDPTRTSTIGVGQMMVEALREGARHIILGLGGSATNDGGCGMAQALGAMFYDSGDTLIETPITGGMLAKITRFDLEPLRQKLQGITVTAACDVTNPLTGPGGAAYIYGPQKGATPKQVEQLDDGLKHLAQLWRGQLGIDVEHTPGSGAAGGLGGGLLAFCNAELKPGLDIVLEQARFDERVRGCDLCLTGEGQLDGQSLHGKAVLGVAKAAAKHGVPTVALVGKLGPGYEKAVDAGLKDAIEIGPGLPADESIAHAAELLEQATRRAVYMYT